MNIHPSRVVNMDSLPPIVDQERKYTKHSVQNNEQVDWQENNMILYNNYCSTFTTDCVVKHPSYMKESGILSSVNVENKDKFYLPVHNENISDIQYDALVLATNAFNKKIIKANKEYKLGFFLGDGTGSGKGRTIVSIISEQMSKGYNKHIWVSTSKDLYIDAKRDVNDMKLGDVVKINNSTPPMAEANVLFISYNSLVSDKSYKEICEWMGSDFNGVIAFDECHRGKNLVITHTKTAKRIDELQEKYNSANILYVSATACSDIRHMAYLDRLGLWGYNHSHFKTFKEFTECMKSGGVCSGEIISMHLKQNGLYISRHLSYDGIRFDVLNIEVPNQYIEIYDACVKLFEDIRTNSFDKFKSKHKMQYWSTVLRFFKCLITIFKMDDVVKYIELEACEDKSFIISLQNTAESYIDLMSHSSEDDVLSSPQFILEQYITSMVSENITIDGTYDIPDGLYKLENPLDRIINHFGVDRVAELTGRKYRFSNKNGKTKRALNNIQERELFINNNKDIVILSDACSTGISLHATNNVERIHIILELPWSAEQFVQQCGRSHRTAETIIPKYKLFTTDIGGEKRFISGIIRKLKMLGALTCGDRNSRLCLSNDIDYETKSSIYIIKQFIKSMNTEEYALFKTAEKGDTVRIFMNKLMMLPFKRQKEIMKLIDNDILCATDDTNDLIGDIVCKDAKINKKYQLDHNTIGYDVEFNISMSSDYISENVINNEYMFVKNKKTKQIYFAHDRVSHYMLHSPVKINFNRVSKFSFDANYEIVNNESEIESCKKYWQSKSRINTKRIYMIMGNNLTTWVNIQKRLSRMNLPMRVKRIVQLGISGFIFPVYNIPEINQTFDKP